jgi:DNA polymerase-3 subunit epsilon
MNPRARTDKLDEAFELLSRSPEPMPSDVIGHRILDLRSRDRRHVRRVVRRLLSADHRFQEVHAGLWEALDDRYGQLPLEEAEFRVLDLEVTGSDPEQNAIIDVAVFAVRGDDVRVLLSTLVDPQIPIPPSIQRLTGIGDEMVRGAPLFLDVLPQLLDVLDDCVFVAHNAAFDYHFLKRTIERSTHARFTAPHICTVKLSQRLLDPQNGSRKLHNLARDLGIPLENRHRAYDDALATACIFVELKKRLRAAGIETVAEMKRYEAGVGQAPSSLAESGAAEDAN